MDSETQAREIQALFPSQCALNPSLQALVDKYRHLWWLTEAEAVEVNQPYNADGDTEVNPSVRTTG